MNHDADGCKRAASAKRRNFLKALEKRTLAAIYIYSVNGVGYRIMPADESTALHNSKDTLEMVLASDGLELANRVLVASQIEITYIIRYLSILAWDANWLARRLAPAVSLSECH